MAAVVDSFFKKELVEEFAKAYEKSGVSQSSQLSKMMKQYIEEVRASK